MPRFYFDIETSSRVAPDSAGVDVADPAAAVLDCMEVIWEAITAAAFEEVKSVTIKDEYQIVIATINVEAIKAATRRARNGEDSADEKP